MTCCRTLLAHGDRADWNGSLRGVSRLSQVHHDAQVLPLKLIDTDVATARSEWFDSGQLTVARWTWTGPQDDAHRPLGSIVRSRITTSDVHSAVRHRRQHRIARLLGSWSATARLTGRCATRPIASGCHVQPRTTQHGKVPLHAAAHPYAWRVVSACAVRYRRPLRGGRGGRLVPSASEQTGGRRLGRGRAREDGLVLLTASLRTRNGLHSLTSPARRGQPTEEQRPARANPSKGQGWYADFPARPEEAA